MATYTFYWPEWACEDAKALGLEGKPLPVYFGGNGADLTFDRFKAEPGGHSDRDLLNLELPRALPPLGDAEQELTLNTWEGRSAITQALPL